MNGNPNDEQVTDTVSIYGKGPGPRAGHSATLLDRRLIIFGGSHGTKYLGDMYLLDTDPVPEPVVCAPSCLQLITSDLRLFLDRPHDASGGGFSDVVLRVEGQPIRAHRIVLSMASERFRAMFDVSRGFQESHMPEVEVLDCRLQEFRMMLEYIYSGEPPAPLRLGDGDGQSECVGG